MCSLPELLPYLLHALQGQRGAAGSHEHLIPQKGRSRPKDGSVNASSNEEMGNGQRAFSALARLPDDEIDLARTAMLIAVAEYPLLDVDGELAVLDSLASAASRRVGAEREPLHALNTLSEYLFDEVGFRGNREDYYDPRNSLLNDVLSRRLGIPITLSLVYVEVGKRLGVPLAGVGMPGHFLVKHQAIDDLYVDPFNGGVLLSESECARRLQEVTGDGLRWDSGYLAPVNNLEFIVRMMRNLKATYVRQQDYTRALRMINWLMALQSEVALERRDRGLIHYEMSNYGDALDDLRAYLESASAGVDVAAVQEIVGRLRRLIED